MNVPPSPAGGVPDADGIPGTPLTYGGAFGDFASHTPVTCSTGGATTRTVTPAPGNSYYLVVSTHGSWEGSYGRTSLGLERPQSASACRPIAMGECGE